MEPRILVVDDDDVLLDLMMRRLHRLGCNADRAENGSYALELMQNACYDLIISDIYMPGCSGLDVLGKALEKDPKAVVLIITGGATIEKALAALEQGAYFYLTKPFDHMSVFDFMVGRALEYRRMKFGESDDRPDAQPHENILHTQGSERSLMLGRTQLYDIVEHYPKGVVVLDSEGKMLLCNPHAKMLMTDFWGSEEAGLAALRSYGSRVNGGEELVHLTARSMKIRSSRFSSGPGWTCTLFSLDDFEDPIRQKSGSMEDALEYMKKALAWMFKRKMTDQEFRVIRAMARQVARIDALNRELLPE